jgi:hypothetical protein
MRIVIKLQAGTSVMLTANDKNYEIRKRTANRWALHKFFTTLGNALECLVDMKLRASDATTLQGLAEDLAAARKEISSAWSTATRIPA